jgi:hypothetical protein
MFIARFAIGKNHILENSLRRWTQIPNMLITLLPTTA